MELGNILGKLKGQEKQEPKKFLALILTDEVVQAAVWSVVKEQTQVIAVGAPVEWDGDTGTTTELVTAVDATISSAVEGLGDEPDSVILGIPHSWTDKAGILGVKREFIRTIGRELELKALGFVVITDSILSYLKMKEGTPTTSILIQVSRDELTLVLVRLGQIEGLESIGRSDDVVEDVTEGIARFKLTDNLPSRIILFNSMHALDDVIQNLLSVDWQTQFNFLHTPKIEALPKDAAIQALALAGGSEVAKSLGFAVSEPAGPGPEAPLLPAQAGTPGVSANHEPIDPVLLTAQEIGFTSPKVDFIDPEDDPLPVRSKEPDPHPPLDSPQTIKPNPRFRFHLPPLHLPHFQLNLGTIKRHWWILGGVLVLLSALVFWLIWLVPKATLTVSVIPKTLEQDVELTLSTADSTVNLKDSVIPAEIQSVQESGEKMIETTGEKTIGDPAQGEVTIYNKTSSTKTFLKDTLVSAGTLKFSLDSDVTIASASSSTEGITFGKNKASVTAKNIGTASNLPSGTEFTLASFSQDSYTAKNEAAFTGGTEEVVQTVGKDDQKLLLTALTEELLEKIKTSSQGLNNPDAGIYLIADSAKVESESYSARPGDLAKTLTLNLTLQASLLKYNTQDVTTLVNSAIDQAVPAGYLRADLPSTVELSASNIKDNGHSVQGKAKVRVALLPVIDHQALFLSLKGKPTTAIEGVLTQAIPGYQNTLVEFAPHWFPTRFKLMIPYNSRNILLDITPIAQ